MFTASIAFTSKFHTPSAKRLGAVKEFVVDVPVETPDTKLESCEYRTLYGVVFKPEPESVEAAQDHVGLLLEIGEADVGVPGIVGAVVSTMKATLSELAVVYVLDNPP